MNIKGFVVSDTGRVRSANEDSWGYCEKEKFFIVADGMGGYVGGKTASNIVVESVGKYLSEAENESLSVSERLGSAIEYANQMVRWTAKQNPELKNMGSTVVAILFDANMAYLCNVGDSRIYLIRNGAMRQLSTDHSLVAELLSRNALTPEEAKTFPQRNVITKMMGMDKVPTDVIQKKCYDEDLFLLCSDGLTNMVEDKEVEQLVLDNKDDPEKACRDLVDLANSRGGLDNITVMIVQITF